MISQNPGASSETKRKRRRRTKPKHDRSGDKKNSPKPDLVDDLSGRSAKKVTVRDLKSDETLLALYEKWCSFHDMRRTPDEMHQRFPIFKENAIRIFNFNQQKDSYTLCLSRWSDRTDKERKSPPIILG